MGCSFNLIFMNLIDSLIDAINVEFDSELEEYNQLQRLTIQERIEKGEALTDFEVNFIKVKIPIEEDGKIIFANVSLSCENNQSNFKVGSRLSLSGHGQIYGIELIEEKDNVLYLTCDWEGKFYSVPEDLNNTRGWVLQPEYVDIRHILLEAAQYLKRDTAKQEDIKNILEGIQKPILNEGKLSEGLLAIKNSSFNESQKEAFINAYASENYYLIQGPPGTGKTHLLAKLAIQFLLEGKKVLITGFTHTAINNALYKIEKISSAERVFKIGKKTQSVKKIFQDSQIINVSYFDKYKYESLEKEGVIVGATCYTLFTNTLGSMHWDIIIFDESGQLSIPLAIAGMCKSDKYIFIGDHKQLPPIIKNKSAIPFYTNSIFEQLIQFREGTMLDTTYRMNKELNEFPSKAFYESKLTTDLTNSGRRLFLSKSKKLSNTILDPEIPDVLVLHNYDAINTRNEFEASEIVKLAEEYISMGVMPQDIAIITPYRAQVRQIMIELYRVFKESDDVLSNLLVDTVERLQGQEKEIVFYSMALSDPQNSLRGDSFFYNLNRFNVAITRAKCKRILFANKKVFSHYSNDINVQQSINIFNEYLNSTCIFEL